MFTFAVVQFSIWLIYINIIAGIIVVDTYLLSVFMIHILNNKYYTQYTSTMTF